MGTSLLSSRQKSMLALCLLISLLAAPAFSAPDFDGNGQIGLSDFFLFADHFGSADAVFDLDANGEVGLSDFFLFASAFGRSAVGVPSPDQGSNGTLFQRRWSYVSETSAVVYWQLGDIGEEGLSYVEYGRTRDLGRRTESTESHPHPRRAHLHRLRDLKSGFVYYYRMVVFDPSSGREAKSEILTFTTHSREGVIRVPDDLSGPPFILDRAGATYLLTRDVSAPGTAFEITASDVTLDLDGHTVLFGDDTDQQVRGVWVRNEGAAVVCNGHIVQGRRSGDYSSAVASRWRPQPTEIFGISTDVHLKCAYPVKMFGATAHLRLHHNHLYSRVTEIESRHYPGNDLLRLDIDGGDIHIHDNLLTEGCHVGIRLIGKGANVEVDHNDIRHHQQYVNGYALSVSCAGSDVHHNRITSCGRGVHLTGDGIHLHDNYLDIYGHQQLSEHRNLAGRVLDGDIIRVSQSQNIQMGVVDIQGHVQVAGRRSLAAAASVSRLLGDARSLKADPYLLFAALETTDPETRARRLFPLNLNNVLQGGEDYALRDGDRLIVLGAGDIRYLSSANVQDVVSHRLDAELRQGDIQAAKPAAAALPATTAAIPTRKSRNRNANNPPSTRAISASVLDGCPASWARPSAVVICAIWLPSHRNTPWLLEPNHKFPSKSRWCRRITRPSSSSLASGT